MRHQSTQRTGALTSRTGAPTSRAGRELPASGYALVVDGQFKTEFKTRDRALNAAKTLKARFPMLQIKVYDADSKLTETIALEAA